MVHSIGTKVTFKSKWGPSGRNGQEAIVEDYGGSPDEAGVVGHVIRFSDGHALCAHPEELTPLQEVNSK